MGYKYDKDEILEVAVEASLEDGVASLTYGRLARRMGINDRMIVYYFPSKDALIGAVIEAHSVKLQALLAEAFAKPAADRIALLRHAWPVLATAAADPTMRVFFELVGLSARGLSPYSEFIPAAMEAWAQLLSGLLQVPEAERRAEAEASMALIDGLLLLRHTLGPEAADRAAARHGVNVTAGS